MFPLIMNIDDDDSDDAEQQTVRMRMTTFTEKDFAVKSAVISSSPRLNLFN